MSTPAAAETRREAPNQGNPFMGLLGRLGNTMQQIAKEVHTLFVLCLSTSKVAVLQLTLIALQQPLSSLPERCRCPLKCLYLETGILFGHCLVSAPQQPSVVNRHSETLNTCGAFHSPCELCCSCCLDNGLTAAGQPRCCPLSTWPSRRWSGLLQIDIGMQYLSRSGWLSLLRILQHIAFCNIYV